MVVQHRLPIQRHLLKKVIVMKLFARRRAFALPILLLTLTAPNLSFAVCDGCVVGAVNSAAAAITAMTEKTSRDISQSVSDALKATAVQLGNVQAKANEMVGQNAIDIEVERQRMSVSRRFQYPGQDPCITVGVAVAPIPDDSPDGTPLGGSAADAGFQNSAGAGGGFSRGGSRRPSSTGNAAMDRTLKVAKGLLAAPPPEIAAADAAVGACSVYSSANVNSYRATACRGVMRDRGFAGAPKFPDADIRAETILGGPQVSADPERFRSQYTWDTTDSKVSDAISAFVRNINTPLQLRDLQPGELGSDEGRRYAALKDSYEARMSLAESPIRHHIGNHSPSKALLGIVETISQSDPFVVDYMRKSIADWRNKGVSVNELMNLEVQRRYYNPDWHERIDTFQEDKDILLEQTRLMAFNNVLMWRLIQDVNRMNVAQAAQITAAVRQEMVPIMTSQHTLATK